MRDGEFVTERGQNNVYDTTGTIKEEQTRSPEQEDMKMSVITITKDNFKKEVMESKVPVLLDFWAGWCGPCRMLSPVIDEIANEMPSVKVGKVNVDEQRELAKVFNIMSIPTLVVIKDGKIVNHAMGVKPKHQIKSMLS
jgi:thioredoxin 1